MKTDFRQLPGKAGKGGAARFGTFGDWRLSLPAVTGLTGFSALMAFTAARFDAGRRTAFGNRLLKSFRPCDRCALLAREKLFSQRLARLFVMA